MKKLIILLILIGNVSAQEVNPAPCIGIDCPGNIETPEEPTDIEPMPPIMNTGDNFSGGVCPGGFEIYPDSQICNRFNDHKETEQNYYHCELHNSQLLNENTILKIQQGMEAPNQRPDCKSFGGQNIFKVNSETRPGSVMLLERGKYCFPGITQDMVPLNIYLESVSGERISNGSFRHCNTANGGRLHYDFPKGSGSAVVRILFEEKEECFFIPERSADQR